MKLTTSLIVSMLAPAAVARPRPLEEGEPAWETSRITAFVVNEQGYPSVECWEISTLSNYQRMSAERADGSKSTGYVMPLASRGDDLTGVDILVWTTPGPIWPPQTVGAQSGGIDLPSNFSLLSVQGGLFSFNVRQPPFANAADDDDDDDEQHIFSLENGDNWFYFEDNYSYSTLANSKNSPAPPITISTVSGGTTEAIRLSYDTRPKHRVVHKGACSFTGISVPEDSGYNAKASPAHSPLTVQVSIEESRGL